MVVISADDERHGRLGLGRGLIVRPADPKPSNCCTPGARPAAAQAVGHGCCVVVAFLIGRRKLS